MDVMISSLNWNVLAVLFIHECSSFITVVVYALGQRWKMIKISAESGALPHTPSLSPSTYLLIYLSVFLSVCSCFIPSFSLHIFSFFLSHPLFLHVFVICLGSVHPPPPSPPGDHKGNNQSQERVRLWNLCRCVCTCVCKRESVRRP